MFAHVSVKKDRFEALLRFLISDAIQPFQNPLVIGRTPNFFEGAKVNSVTISASPHERQLFLGQPGPNNTVMTVPNVLPITYRVLRIRVGMDIWLATEAAMIQASFNPPATSVIPLHGLDLRLYLDVDSSGVARLHLEPEQLPELGLPEPARATLEDLLTINSPLPLGAAMGPLAGGGSARVLNAGVHFASDGAIVFRVEFEGPDWAQYAKRYTQWGLFFTGHHDSDLGRHEWCVDAPTGGLCRRIEQEAKGSLKNGKAFEFTTAPWVTWLWGEPAFKLHTAGFVPHACAGNDMRVKLWVTVRFSIPQRNVVRVHLRLDYEKDAWDMTKCVLLSTFVWPIVGLVTFVENKVPWWGFTVYFVLIAAPFLIAPLFLIAQITGVEEALVGSVVSDELEKATKDDGKLQKVSDYEYYRDIPMPPLDPIVRDWVALDEIAAASDHLLVRGALLVPPPVMPRLVGGLETPFGEWAYEDRCRNTVDFKNYALVQLKVVGDSGPPKPNIEIKGADPRIGGQWPIPYALLDDVRGYYHSQLCRISYTGVPGQFEIKLKISRMNEYQFASAPYPLRLRLLTSGGARQFDIPAPPPLPSPPAQQTPEEQHAAHFEEIAWKMSNCYRRGHLFALIKRLQVFWLPMPPPDARVAQHWIVRIDGLAPGEQVIVRDGETGEPLRESIASRDGAVERRLLLDGRDFHRSLQLTRGDTPFANARAYKAMLRRTKTPAEPPPIEIAVTQTLLAVEDRVEFDAPAEWLELTDDRGVWNLRAGTREAVKAFRWDLSRGLLRTPAFASGEEPGAELLEARIPPIRDGHGVLSGDLYIELSRNRRAATIYRRTRIEHGGFQV